MSDSRQQTPPDGTPTSFGDAVQSAIDQSLVAADALQAQVNEALRIVRSSLTEDQDAAAAPEVVRSLRSSLQATHSEATDLFARQRQALSTVNLALFGRTGAGKSSLIEALSHGAGLTISTGECDFTVAVRSTTWKGVEFLDTPGINGWGRTVSRDELESRTRKAVEVADIVVLCFDSSSQVKFCAESAADIFDVADIILGPQLPRAPLALLKSPLWLRLAQLFSSCAQPPS